MADKEALVNQFNECVEKKDFAGAFKVVRENRQDLDLTPAGIREALKKATDDRLVISFLDGVEFGAAALDVSLVRLEKLLTFTQGARVLSKAWGLGVIRRLDYFYRRITVDFKTKKGHQFTYGAATDTLVLAPDDHILVKREADPAAFEKMLKEQPAEFVKALLKSYGDMTIVKMEDICAANGFVKSVNWKKFWDGARADLRKDALVEIPAKRADPIRLKASVEDYGTKWLTAFVQETDPKLILAAVREFVARPEYKACDAETKAKIEERLVFAVTAARKVDDALYARLACEVTALGFARPAAAEMRAYLWERKRFVKAAAMLPSREVGAMIRFLACDDAAKAKLCAAIPELCFTAVVEIVNQFQAQTAVVPTTEEERAAEPDKAEKTVWPYRQAIGAFMKEPTAPATLTTLIVGKIESFGAFKYGTVDVDGKQIKVLKSFALWPELPSLITLLTHAVALGEGRRGGETLRMQNLVRRLFGDKAWLEKMFKMLSAADQAVFFERFQASIAWEASTHHAIVVRMTKLVPELEAHLVKVEKKREYARVTSFRSFAMKKQEYLKLINEDMPANVKRIEFAKGFGDLSENAEYQYAKDEQRALMQKQTLMQEDLETVKPDDFAAATTDEVMPGVTVVVSTPEGEKTYHVLGEWDNDIERGILSSKTRLAGNMLGKKPGEEFELPGAENGVAFGRIVEIKALPDDIRAWMKLPVGMQI